MVPFIPSSTGLITAVNSFSLVANFILHNSHKRMIRHTSSLTSKAAREELASRACGIRHRETTARIVESRTSVSTSVDTSPVQERPGSSPTGPVKDNKLFQNTQDNSRNMQISTYPLI